MAFTDMTDDVAIIAALADLPNATSGLTAAQLKVKFDTGSTLIKTYLNSILTPELESTTDGDSGADNIGATAISGLTGATVQVLLEALKTYIDAATIDGTYAADAGSTDTYAITVTPAPSVYTAGNVYRFKANTANTGVATLNVNSLGAKTIKKRVDLDLVDNDIKKNQIVELIYDGTNFQLLSPSTPDSTSANLTYYVNASTGSDSNDGLTSGAPFLTITKAISVLPQTINHTVTITVATGTYAETITIAGFVGKGDITINGSANLAGATSYNVNNFIVQRNAVIVLINGFNATITSLEGFSVTSNNARCNIQYCQCTTVSAVWAGFKALNSMTVAFLECTASNRANGIQCQGGLIYSYTNNGSGNTNGLYCDTAGKIGKSGSQPAGTTAEFTAGGGQIV